jgi:hypothetical protein
MTGFTIDSLGSVIAAAGALGTTSFGIVEALKWTPLGTAGFGQIRSYLGPELEGALRIAYGDDYARLLRAQYREDSQQQSVIAKSLRQGLRIGLTPDNAEAIARYLGTVGPAELKAAALAVQGGKPLSDDHRGALGRFELAADARVTSALARAQDAYLGWVRGAASAVSVLLAEFAAYFLSGTTTGTGGGAATAAAAPGAAGLPSEWLIGLLVGIVAVPLAPIANDVVGALQAATKALRGR